MCSIFNSCHYCCCCKNSSHRSWSWNSSIPVVHTSRPIHFWRYVVQTDSLYFLAGQFFWTGDVRFFQLMTSMGLHMTTGFYYDWAKQVIYRSRNFFVLSGETGRYSIQETTFLSRTGALGAAAGGAITGGKGIHACMHEVFWHFLKPALIMKVWSKLWFFQLLHQQQEILSSTGSTMEVWKGLIMSRPSPMPSSTLFGIMPQENMFLSLWK